MFQKSHSLFCFIVISLLTVLSYQKTVAQALNGIYMVGAGEKYTSPTAAASALGAGISGPVVFNIKRGTYTGAITIGSVSGSSATNTITFQADATDATADSANVIITSASYPATLTLSGVNYMTFKKLTIQQTGENTVISITNGSNYLSFLNCQLIGYQFTSLTQEYDGSVVYSTSGDAYPPMYDNYINFSNNLIKWGSRGLDIEAYQNDDEPPYDEGAIINHNTFINQASYGLYLSCIDSLIITANTMSTNVDDQQYCVYLNYCPNQINFSYNKIYNNSGNGWGVFWNQCHAQSNAPSMIYNNFIKTGGTGGNGLGLELWYCMWVNVYHNNILSTHIFSTGNNDAAMHVNGAGADSPETQAHYVIINNNFVNTGGGYAFSTDATDLVDQFENNNYFSSSSKYLCCWDPYTTCATLAAWESSSGESPAYNINPNYVAATTNLHSQNILIKGLGANLTVIVSDDIDHYTRPDPPTIGANEIIGCTSPTASIPGGNQTDCSGGNVEFSVTSEGTGTLSYQWMQNSNDIAGATSKNYQLTTINESDAGTYSCLVKNSCGSTTSNSVTLNINTPPAVTSQTANQTRCSGDTVSFKIKASGTPSPSYQWMLGGQNISNATNSFYSISNLKNANAGNYSCYVSNSCNNVTSGSITLNVIQSPAVTNTIPSQTVCLNQPVTFTIDASGSNISYQWSQGGSNINGATNSIYTITKATEADDNYYSCTLSNSCGTTNLPTFILTVNMPPSSGTAVINDTKYFGDSVSFNISPAGSAPFSYQWNLNNKNISGATSNNYQISAINYSDSGYYSCEIKNMCDSVNAEIAHLIVINPTRFRYTLSGQIFYDNSAATLMNNTTVILLNSEGVKMDSMTTSDTGAYTFPNLLNGKYTLECRTTISWGGSNPLDALLANRYFIQAYSITDPLKLLAADVNMDGKINPLDALLINRRFIGVIKKFTRPDWIFESPSVIINGNNYTQNINAICTGDVNGSYVPK